MAAYNQDGKPMYFAALVVDCGRDEVLIKNVLRKIKDTKSGTYHKLDEIYKVYKTDSKRAEKDDKDLVVSLLATDVDSVYRFGKSLIQLHDSIKVMYDLAPVLEREQRANNKIPSDLMCSSVQPLLLFDFLRQVSFGDELQSLA